MLYFTILYSTLLYSTLLYSTLLYSSPITHMAFYEASAVPAGTASAPGRSWRRCPTVPGRPHTTTRFLMYMVYSILMKYIPYQDPYILFTILGYMVYNIRIIYIYISLSPYQDLYILFTILGYMAYGIEYMGIEAAAPNHWCTVVGRQYCSQKRLKLIKGPIS